ncbi:hypothetical protein JCM11491_000496 [Sporobolomyces phaffii]
MLASILAPYITGRYDVTCVPIAIPAALVTMLLPALWGDGAPIFLSQAELRRAGLDGVPDPGDGNRWAVVQVGQQISTGVGFGPGRKTFYEAKLEVPFLRHPLAARADPPTPFTYKHTLLFSSHLMALSSQHISGLTSSKVGFRVDPATYQAEGYFSVKDHPDDDASGPGSRSNRGPAWSPETIKTAFEGWFVGENTGPGATRFHTKDITAPKSRASLHVRLHLPTLTGLPLEAVTKLLGNEPAQAGRLDGEGWYDVTGVEGYELSVETRMEVCKLDQL